MPKLVVDGAILACSMGTSPSKLSVQPTNETYGGWNLAATVRDMLPETNLAPFGMCQSPINPKVAAAPSAAAGVLTPQPCVPAAAGPWTPGSKTVAITGGGWRKYDLPPMIDLEHECQSGEDALALFPALIAMARAMRTNFAGVAPFLYMGPSYLGTMRTMAQKAYAKVAADAADAARAAHAPRPRSSFLSPTWSTSFLSASGMTAFSCLTSSPADTGSQRIRAPTALTTNPRRRQPRRVTRALGSRRTRPGGCGSGASPIRR